MSANKKRNVLAKDTEFAVKMKQRHPRNFMRLGGVVIYAGPAQNYVIPKGTDLDSKEVQTWFEISSDLVKGPVNKIEEQLKHEKEAKEAAEAAKRAEEEAKAKAEKDAEATKAGGGVPS